MLTKISCSVLGTPHPPPQAAVPLPPLGKVGFSGNRSKSYRGNTHKQFCPYFTLYRKESITSYLPQRGKVADVSAKQIYDRLRSSRMTDEVLLTNFTNKNRFSALGTPHPPLKRSPFPRCGRLGLGVSLHCKGVVCGHRFKLDVEAPSPTARRIFW